MNDVYIGKGKLEGKGVYAGRDFKKDEIVIKYTLKAISESEYEQLPKIERNYVHSHWGQLYLYSEPERYVNHNPNPNTYQDLVGKNDIALKDIKKGEMITCDHTKDNTE